jgi:hypothetical protein
MTEVQLQISMARLEERLDSLPELITARLAAHCAEAQMACPARQTATRIPRHGTPLDSVPPANNGIRVSGTWIRRAVYLGVGVGAAILAAAAAALELLPR